MKINIFKILLWILYFSHKHSMNVLQSYLCLKKLLPQTKLKCWCYCLQQIHESLCLDKNSIWGFCQSWPNIKSFNQVVLQKMWWKVLSLFRKNKSISTGSRYPIDQKSDHTIPLSNIKLFNSEVHEKSVIEIFVKRRNIQTDRQAECNNDPNPRV